LVAELRRLSAAGTTLATWATAGEVRRRLASADFLLERRRGFGGKREMLVGRRPGLAPTRLSSPRHIAVIGAGIAGAATAHALARRGHQVTVLDAAGGAASGASGNLAGVFRPLPALDDGRLARVLRAGFLLGRRSFPLLAGPRLGWTGVLHIARDSRHEQTQQRIVKQHSLPADYCRFVTRDEASLLAGSPVALGGWWFPQAGWINPPSLCRSLLAGIECRYNFPVSRLQRQGDVWRISSAGIEVEADTTIVANGIGASALVPEFSLPIRPGRGMVSHLPEAATAAMDIVATRLGYVTPPIDGLRCAGATLQADDLDASPRLADHVENLFRLDMLLPGFARGIDPAQLTGRVSFRPMSPIACRWLARSPPLKACGSTMDMAPGAWSLRPSAPNFWPARSMANRCRWKPTWYGPWRRNASGNADRQAPDRFVTDVTVDCACPAPAICGVNVLMPHHHRSTSWKPLSLPWPPVRLPLHPRIPCYS
jgi:tRNA 5-methylaminomethyl-2-thiouridine biosynthesis bifunctional protein